MKKQLINLLFILTIISLYLLAGCSVSTNTDITPASTTFIETVLIPAGTFGMGNTGAYSDDYNEKPVHGVTLTKAFYMGKYEITQKQWKAVMGTNPSNFKGDDLPVEMVSWFDAIEFCNKLSEKDTLTKCYTFNDTVVTCNWNANGWRLPTEAEWEYACKAGTTSDFYTGQLANKYFEPIDSNLSIAGWYGGNSSNTTHHVGLKLANAFGLYDMHGNVLEWFWDFYGRYSSGALTDPKGESTGEFRVLRGGSWFISSEFCRSSCRFNIFPFQTHNSFGFRISRTN